MHSYLFQLNFPGVCWELYTSVGMRGISSAFSVVVSIYTRSDLDNVSKYAMWPRLADRR